MTKDLLGRNVLQLIITLLNEFSFYFDEKNRFVLNFNASGNENEIKETFFAKDKDYFITSMKYFLKIQPLFEDLGNYKEIKKLSDAANKIIDAKNGLYDR